MRWIASVLVVVGGLGCGDAGGDGNGGVDAAPGGDAAAWPDAGAGPVFDRSAGTIRVVEGRGVDFEGTAYVYTRADAQLSDAAQVLFQTETMRAGACRLLELADAFCDPFCDGICLPGNDCRPWPRYKRAGAITLGGLTEPLELLADPPLNGYGPSAWPLPDDLFAPGAAITASAPGADLPAFSVAARGVSTLETDLGATIELVDDQDLVVTWTPAADGARVRLTLNSPNQAHGQPLTGIIECDAPDTGSLTVPGELITAFPSSPGLDICVGHDCPPSQLARYTRGTAALGDQQVELIVSAEVQLGVQHD